MDSVDEMLDTLSSFSEKIEQAIGCEDWDALNDVLIHRQKFLEKLFSVPIKPTQHSSVIDLMLKIQKEDSLHMAVMQDQKYLLQKHATSLSQGRKNVKAYQSEQD